MRERIIPKSYQEQNSENFDSFVNERTDLLKAISHPIRFKILLLLSSGPKDFSFLLTETQISRANLGSHLTILLKNNLVLRLNRGKYEITKDGTEFLKSLENIYGKSDLKRSTERIKLKKEFAGLIEKQNLPEKLVSKIPTYELGWNSYISCLTGVLKSKGIDCDKEEVGGRTGYSFLNNVAKGEICSSVDRMLSEEAWLAIIEGTESFGWKTVHKFEKTTYTLEESSYNDTERFEILFDKICKIIEKNDTPVIMKGIPAGGYGIVKGFMEKSYIVSTFRPIEGKGDPPINIYDIPWTLPIDYFYLLNKLPKKKKEVIDKKALERALIFAQGINVSIKTDIVSKDGYVSGPECFNEWANCLEDIKNDLLTWFSHCYLIQIYMDSKNNSSVFLERLSLEYSKFPQAIHLRDAARAFNDSKQLFEELNIIFPYYKRSKSNFTNENRKKGAELLRMIKSHEIKAITKIKDALKVWIFQSSVTKNKTEKVLEQESKYQACWNSFIASVSGILRNFDPNIDIYDVGGRSGLSFLTNMYLDKISESADTSFSFLIWDEIITGISSFGWKLNRWIDYSPAKESLEQSQRIFDQVKLLIEKYETPVILWGPDSFSYSIVNGYNENSYIISSFRENVGELETPIRFDKFQRKTYPNKTPTGYDLFYFTKEKIEKDEKTINIEILNRIIKFTEGKFGSQSLAVESFILGPEAYEKWAHQIEIMEDNPNNIYGHTYLLEVYRDAKETESVFLGKFAWNFRDSPQGNFLWKAANIYHECEKLFRYLIQFFPFLERDKIQLSPDLRKRGIYNLRKIKIHEIEAIKLLKKAKEVWKE